MAERKDPIASIQFLRAFAALGVVLMHNFFFFDTYAGARSALVPSVESWHQFKTIGGIGVDIFFVISGFIMGHLASLNPNQTPGSFFGRRLSRIVPIYWVVTAFSIWWDPSRELSFVLKSFLFFPVNGVFPVMGVGWTLNYEMFFYVLFGVIVVAMRKSVWWIALIFAGFGIASMFSKSYILQFYGNPIVWNFVAGIAVQRLYRTKTAIVWSPIIFAAGISGIVFSMGTYAPSSEWSLLAVLHWGPPSVLLVLGAASLEAAGLVSNLFTNRLIQAIGESSYSLYLIHGLLFISVNFQLLKAMNWIELNPNVELIALLAVACGAAYASFRLIELPAQQALRAGWNRATRIAPKPRDLMP